MTKNQAQKDIEFNELKDSVSKTQIQIPEEMKLFLDDYSTALAPILIRLKIAYEVDEMVGRRLTLLAINGIIFPNNTIDEGINLLEEAKDNLRMLDKDLIVKKERVRK